MQRVPPKWGSYIWATVYLENLCKQHKPGLFRSKKVTQLLGGLKLSPKHFIFTQHLSRNLSQSPLHYNNCLSNHSNCTRYQEETWERIIIERKSKQYSIQQAVCKQCKLLYMCIILWSLCQIRMFHYMRNMLGFFFFCRNTMVNIISTVAMLHQKMTLNEWN